MLPSCLCLLDGFGGLSRSARCRTDRLCGPYHKACALCSLYISLSLSLVVMLCLFFDFGVRSTSCDISMNLQGLQGHVVIRMIISLGAGVAPSC